MESSVGTKIGNRIPLKERKKINSAYSGNSDLKIHKEKLSCLFKLAVQLLLLTTTYDSQLTYFQSGGYLKRYRI